jgi:outer membrane lipoprotein-sorting protein
MKLKSLALAALLAIPALTAPSTVYADASGDQALVKVDKMADHFRDQTYTASMEIFRGGSKTKTIEFNMKMKGLEKQYIEFTAPGDVAGMKILMTNADTIWMYSPEFKKVRRVAAHAQEQGMFGSEFGAEDMVMAKLSNAFTAELKGRSGNVATLELAPKPGTTIRYSKLEVDLDKGKGGGIVEIRYYDGAGNHVRTQKRAGWKKVSGKPFPTKISMKNLKTGNETVVHLNDIKVNQGVEDSLFSKRTLLRG